MCKFHDSCAVVAGTDLVSDMLLCIQATLKQIFTEFELRWNNHQWNSPRWYEQLLSFQNSSTPGDVYMHQKNRSSLVYVMAFRLFE